MKPSARVQQVIAAFHALGTADQELVLRKLRLVRRSPADEAPADIETAVSGVDWLAELAAGPGERNVAEPWKPVRKNKPVEPGTVSAVTTRMGTSR